MKTGNSKSSSLRKPLGTIGRNTRDKENVVIGKTGSLHSKDAVTKSASKRTTSESSASKELHSTTVQTDDSQVDVNDLTTSGPPSVTYWKILAEQRLKALEKTLKENEELHIKVEKLENQKKAYKEMLDETNALVEVLQEMIGNDEDSSDDGNGLDSSV